MTVGVIVAHPDDESFGMGATIARLCERAAVHLLVLGDGVTSRPGAGKAEMRQRRQECCRAAVILRIRSVEFRRLPDNRFDWIGVLGLSRVIRAWLRRIKPDTVYSHFHGDLNLDHRLTAEAVLVAMRPEPRSRVRALYAFEVPSSTEWAFGCTGTSSGFRPNTFIDVTDTLEAKITALRCYEGEMREFPHPRSELALRVRTQYWGSVCGCRCAEAFELLRAVR